MANSTDNLYAVIAEDYGQLMNHFDYEAWAARFEAVTKISHGASILDVACGTGTLTALLAMRGYTVSGMDISENMLTAAKQAYPQIIWQQQSIENFSVDTQLDAIVCCLDGLNHLPDIETLRCALCCIKNALKPGGIFFFDMLTPDHYSSLENKLFSSKGKSMRLKWTCHINEDICRYDFIIKHKRTKTKLSQQQLIIRDIDTELTRAGFSVVSSEHENGRRYIGCVV